MITLIAASLAAAAPAAQPAPVTPRSEHMSAHSDAAGQVASEHKMAGMKGCCCCKDMDGKPAAHVAPAKPSAQGHAGH